MTADKSPLLVVMAKQPIAGRVKTRLTPALSFEEAAGLYRCLLEDRLDEMSRLDTIELAVAYMPAGAESYFTSLVSPRTRLFRQQGNDLSEKLARLIDTVFGQGYPAVAFVDSDSPDLDRHIVRQAFDVLFNGPTDVVLGPCYDGGYYLIGLRAGHPGLFADIPWSTDRVLGACLENAARLKLTTALLPIRSDIDRADDIDAFVGRYRYAAGNGKSRPGHRTYRYLKTLGY